MRLWVGLTALIILAGCDRQPESVYEPSFSARPATKVKEYVVGILPQHNMQRLLDLYAPVLEQINEGIPDAHFKMEASRSFEEFEKKLYAGHFDFAMLNPYQTVLSLKHGYHVFGKMADDKEFRGIILIRKDSGIRNVSELKGKRVSYPAVTALAAGLMPQYFLHTHGIDVNHDIENIYVGSQESSIMNVVLGHVAAGASWPPPWKTFNAEHPELASQLEVKWQTEPLLNNGWVVRKDIPPALSERFGAVLFALNNSEQGIKVLQRLQISRFESASDSTYVPVRNFLNTFSVKVRPVER